MARSQATPAGAGLAPKELEERAEEAERRANGQVNVAFAVSFVAGPLIGGAVTAGAGVAAALLIDVASFLICAALLLDLNPYVEGAGGAESVGRACRPGCATSTRHPSLRSLLIAEAVALTFIQAGSPMEVAYAKDTLSAGDGGYGLLVAAWGGGSVLASIVFARNRALAAAGRARVAGCSRSRPPSSGSRSRRRWRWRAGSRSSAASATVWSGPR